MKKHFRALSFMIFAAMLTLLSASCRTGRGDWENTLPEVATTSSQPAVIYETEETTTSESLSITSAEKISRTAATVSEPELATTTATVSSETEEPEISIVSDVPKIPISEFTSSTAHMPTASQASSSETPSETGGGSLNEITESRFQNTETIVEDIVAVGSSDPDPSYSGKEKSLRPYSYDFLSEKQLYIYDALITAIEQRKTSVKFSEIIGVTSDDYCDVYQILYNDECSLFYLDTKMQYAVNASTKNVASANIFYSLSDEEIDRRQNVIDNETARIISKIMPSMTEYDIVKLFYDYLAENVVYDENAENCRSIYGVFGEKKAICGGYAKAFEYLCSKVGIEAITITGDADEVPHMWNMVLIDGKWYHIDPTYAVTESKVGKYVRYDYFCVTDEVISRTRTVYEQSYKYPTADSEDCSYYVRNGLIADSWEDVKSMLTSEIIKASKDKRLVAEVQCSSKETYETSVYNLFDRSQAQAINIMESALQQAENKYQCENISYSQDPGTYVLKLFLEYTDQ